MHRKGWFVQWNFNEKARSNQTITEDGNTKTIASNDSIRKSIPSNPTDLEGSTPLATKESLEQMEALSKVNARKTPVDETNVTPTIVAKKKKLGTSGLKRSYKIQQQAQSPTRVPMLAWILLIVGSILLVLGITLAIIFLITSGSLIDAPFFILAAVVAGILFLVLAAKTALSTFNSQPSSPDPRFEKEEPKKEKKERQPLKKGDKIFLAVITGLILIIGVVLLSY